MPWNLRRCAVILSARAACTQPVATLESRCVFRRDSGSLTIDVPPSETSRWRAVARVLRSPLDAVSCALLPASCVLCGSPLPRLSSTPICDACWTEFPLLSGDGCVRCGDTLDRAFNDDGLCRACRLVPPPFVHVAAYGLYDGRMRQTIHALKYDRIRSAAPKLGKMLAQAIAQLAGKAPADMLVVPVPLHRSKHALRGFNQSRLLALEALKDLHKSHPAWRLTLAPGTLIRLHATESQAGLTPRARRLNVRGAFSVSGPAAVRERHVLLVDDILTTGATARAAAGALIGAGASSVWVAVLARARRADGFPSGGPIKPEGNASLDRHAETGHLQEIHFD
jgi:ComF family protein